MGGRLGSGGGLSLLLRGSPQGGRKDPLLAIARLLLGLTTAFFVIAAAAITLAIPAVLVLRDQVIAHLLEQGAPSEAIWGVVVLLLLAVLATLLGFYFFRNLYRIIDTVAEGDPFVPINARRLSAMGWITVAGYVLAIPLNALSQWLESMSSHFHEEFGLSMAGILLAIVLFILARVFREGTRMREELEGTV